MCLTGYNRIRHENTDRELNQRHLKQFQSFVFITMHEAVRSVKSHFPPVIGFNLQKGLASIHILNDVLY